MPLNPPVPNFNILLVNSFYKLNKFKLVYKSALLGFVLNALLDVPIMLLFNVLGIPPFLGAGTASIIGYASASIYVLYVLRKEHNLRYGKTFRLVCNLILPILNTYGILDSTDEYKLNDSLNCFVFISKSLS